MRTRHEIVEQRGFVLVTVLWILAILTVISLGFGRRSMMERRVAAYTLDHAQAMQMARGALERGIAELANKSFYDARAPGGGYYTGLDQRWARPLDLLRDEPLYRTSEDPEFDNDRCFYIIRDNGSRISINFAPEELLHDVDGLSFLVVREIMSRREARGRSRVVQRFFSIDELRDLRGMDDEDWMGEDGNPGLRDLFTVWGDRKINLNTASEAVLLAIPDIRNSVVSKIIGYRVGPDAELGTQDDKAFKNIDDLSKKLKITGSELTLLSRYCKTTSNSFTIDAYATRRGGLIVAHCQAIVTAGGRSVLQWSENTLGT